MHKVRLKFLDKKYDGHIFRYETEGDGSCFFHAICNSISPIYRSLDIEMKRDFVDRFREQLSEKLFDLRDNDDKTWYEYLGNGTYNEFSQCYPAVSLENMTEELNSRHAVSNIYNEYLSEMLGINIFIIDIKHKDLYHTGDDNNLLFKNRDSIFIAYIEKQFHYEYIGYFNKNIIRTMLPWDHHLVKELRKKI